MKKQSSRFSRRSFLLASTAFVVFSATAPSFARVVSAIPKWQPGDVSLPEYLPDGSWYFLAPDEVETLGAVVERLIPADELSISGKEAGCVEFIDRQLAGSYGTFERYYMQPPFVKGTPYQGDQSELVPQQRYRIGLKALNDYCQSQYSKRFAALDENERDKILAKLETGDIELQGIDAKLFFSIMLQNTMEGFFADPIYGGNKNMVSWRMIGFPGARYDYRAFIHKHNQKLALEPVSIAGQLNLSKRG